MKFQFTVGKVAINTTEVLGTDHINGTEEKSPETKFHTAPVNIQIENIGFGYEMSSEEIDVLQTNARENIEAIATTIENHIEPIAMKFLELERHFENTRREDMEREETRQTELRAKREAERQARLEKLRARNEELKFERRPSKLHDLAAEILSVDPEELQQEINKMIL